MSLFLFSLGFTTAFESTVCSLLVNLILLVLLDRHFYMSLQFVKLDKESSDTFHLVIHKALCWDHYFSGFTLLLPESTEKMIMVDKNTNTDNNYK